MHGTAGGLGGSPLPGTGTAWSRPRGDAGLLPMDGGGSRGWIWSGAGVEPLGRPRGRNRGNQRGEGKGPVLPRERGSLGAAWTCGGEKGLGVGGREKERERGGVGGPG